MRKPKFKIKTKGKSYSIKDSPLYNLRTKKHLANLLNCNTQDFSTLSKDDGNYNVFETTGKNGKKRKIHKPQPQLDKIHTRIASLLCRIDAPDYLHSGRKNRSNITNAQAHITNHSSETAILATDIRDFFTSTHRKNVFNFFYTIMKCSTDVADILAKLSTIHEHVPTGSRISMPIAFWANYHMFEELHALSSKYNVCMTVYVDDLTFSGNNVNPLFRTVVEKIVSRYGHKIHPTKTKLYAKAAPKLVTGVIVKNQSLQVRNEQFKQLVTDFTCWKAIRNTPQAIFDPHTYRLLGRLHSMGSIEPVFREKARTVKGATNR
ncbi:reverse transcriptase family protein [Shewanella algae]|uniref:reverse transcriptase family protein n=1 Tax=Shewanella algae TaxID=38313 RepID=UPI001AAD9CAB|nr:reverse transcriptase family protein [Shewanella algae]MBO2599107.1 RNA-directed DNA polymerase [Shewanella algae]MBO2614520.1 RNA-directed DNA polymerase [Shewanella algae]